MNIKQILENSTKNPLELKEKELTIALAIKKDLSFVIAHPEFKLSQKQVRKINTWLNKRMRGFPLAYLSGYKYFYGLRFKVSPAVLIPRPETELIIEYIITTFKDQAFSLIDVGSGSGCIPLALAYNIPLNNSYLGLDISRSALSVARLNKQRLVKKKNIKFASSDLLGSLLKSKRYIDFLDLTNKQKTLIITANLPYLRPNQIKQSVELKYEPRLALDGGSDGLKYYRRLLLEINKLPYKEGREILLIMEIDPQQDKALTKLTKQTFALAIKNLTTKNDLSGTGRFIIAKLSF